MYIALNKHAGGGLNVEQCTLLLFLRNVYICIVSKKKHCSIMVTESVYLKRQYCCAFLKFFVRYVEHCCNPVSNSFHKAQIPLCGVFS